MAATAAEEKRDDVVPTTTAAAATARTSSSSAAAAVVAVLLMRLLVVGTCFPSSCRAFSPASPQAKSRSATTSAASNPTTTATTSRHRPFLPASAALAPVSSSERRRTTKTTWTTARGGAGTKSNGGEEEDKSRRPRRRLGLELDSDGNLRLDNGEGDGGGLLSTVLMNGLTPSIWSPSRPTKKTSSKLSSDFRRRRDEDDDGDGDNSCSSLFLHANYAEERSEHENKLGDLVSCRRLLACSRITRYWMGPKVGTGAQDVPFDTQFLLVEVERDGPYALLLPLVENGFRASLHYGDEGTIEVICLAESGDAAVTARGMQRALYVSVGDDPYELLRTGFEQVSHATGTFLPLREKKLPPSVDEFGWCTWDAFYSDVSPDGVREGVRALTEAGVPPRTVILDDGWQQVTPAPPNWKRENSATATTAKETAANGSSGSGNNKNNLSSLLSSLTGNAISGFYDRYVKRAPHGSTFNKIWTRMSKGVLKSGLWDYFDSETDFNRQLSDFSANRKFESRDGSETSLKGLVSELKRDFGVKTVLCWHVSFRSYRAGRKLSA